MRKNIVNLGSNTGKKNDNSSTQLTYIQNSLLMSIFDTPENILSNADRKSDMKKLPTYSVDSSSKLFSYSIRTMYNRFNFDQK